MLFLGERAEGNRSGVFAGVKVLVSTGNKNICVATSASRGSVLNVYILYKYLLLLLQGYTSNFLFC
jgi:hypothetical protein